MYVLSTSCTNHFYQCTLAEAYEDQFNDIFIRDPCFYAKHQELFNTQMTLLTRKAHKLLEREPAGRNSRQMTMAFSATPEFDAAAMISMLEKKIEQLERAREKQDAAGNDPGPAGKRNKAPRDLPPTPGQCRFYWVNETRPHGADCRYDHKGPRKNQRRPERDGKNLCGVPGHKGHAKQDCWKLHPEKAPGNIRKALAKANKAKVSRKKFRPKEERKYPTPGRRKAHAGLSMSLQDQWDDGADVPDSTPNDAKPLGHRRATARTGRNHILPLVD